MPELSRSQVFVYGAVAIALLLVGARAIRAEGSGTPVAPVAFGAATGGGGVSIGSAGSDLVVDVAGRCAGRASTGCRRAPG